MAEDKLSKNVLSRSQQKSSKLEVTEYWCKNLWQTM